MAKVTKNDKELILGEPVFVDSVGKPAAVDSYTYSVSDPSVIEYVENEAGEKLIRTKEGIVGVAEVICRADKKIGEGEEFLEIREGVVVEAAEAVGGALSFAGERPRTS